MNTIDATTKTPAEWLALAARARDKRAESFDRCDTDGFLTQAALHSERRLYEKLADLAEKGGVSEFRVVTDLDDNILDAKEVEGRYGMSYRIWNPDTRKVAWFSPSNAKNGKRRVAANAAKGYKVQWAEAKAVIEETGWQGGYVVPADDAEYRVVRLDDENR